MLESVNFLGAVVAVLFYASAIGVFLCRIMGSPRAEHWFGYLGLCLTAPLVFMLITAPALHRSWLYLVQVSLMLAWLVIEGLVDYVLRIDFRQNRWMVIGYVVLFFAGSGGMLGVASYAGRSWITTAGVLFLAMTALTFIQRRVTGR